MWGRRKRNHLAAAEILKRRLLNSCPCCSVLLMLDLICFLVVVAEVVSSRRCCCCCLSSLEIFFLSLPNSHFAEHLGHSKTVLLRHFYYSNYCKHFCRRQSGIRPADPCCTADSSSMARHASLFIGRTLSPRRSQRKGQKSTTIILQPNIQDTINKLFFPPQFLGFLYSLFFHLH